MSFHEFFPNRFEQICIISVSGDCMRRLFETCQIFGSRGKCDRSISKKLLVLFGGFLLFETSVRLVVERLQRGKCGIIYCMHCHVRYIHNVGKNGRTPSNLAQWASSPGATARRGGGGGAARTAAA